MSSIFSRFQLSSIRRMLANAKAVHNYSGKNTFLILCDMARCILKDHVGYMEYNLFHFVDKSPEDRQTYVTFDYSQALIKKVNDREYYNIFNDKLSFNRIFKDYLGRDFLDIEASSYEDFETFCKGKEVFFCKPAGSCSGQGIYKNIYLDENSDLKKIYQYLKDNHLFVEGSILQHEEMNKLNPTSINTVRVVTLLAKKDVPHIVYVLQRIGRKGMMVDNIGAGGIYTVLSDEGEIIHPCWSDKTLKTYMKHPDSGFELIGFRVPYFKEALELCRKAAVEEKRVRYVGWDIAITEKGPVIVEGNPLPGYDMSQNYFVTGRDTGLKPVFEEILK